MSLPEVIQTLHASWHAFSVAAVSAVILFIGIFILLQNPRSAPNRAFYLICFAVNMWLFGCALLYATGDAVMALFLYKSVTFAGVAFIPTSVYYFSVVWLKLREKQRWAVRAGFLLSAAFYLAGWFLASTFPYVYDYYWGYYPHYGPAAVVFLGFFFAYFFAAFTNFVRAYLAEASGARKKQIRLIAVAFLISFTGSIDFLPKLGYFPVYPIGYLCVFTWIMMVAFAIIKYKVMDIETVVHKTLMWLILSSIIFLPLTAIFYFGRNFALSIHPAVSSALCVGIFLLFMAYSKTVQPWIDHIFQRRKYDLEKALIRFGENLVHLKGLSELVEFMVRTVRETLYVENVEVYLKDARKETLTRIDRSVAAGPELSSFHPFIRILEEEDAVAQRDYIDIDPRFEHLRDSAREFFDRLGAQVTVPLVLNGELIGLINLGAKANLQRFREPEIKFLSDFRNSAAIAFSNTLRLLAMQEQLKKWNEELELKVKQRTRELEEAQEKLIQAEKLATLGTLAGGVAHEINNPLTAVLTNAQILKLSLTDSDEAESVQLIEEGAKRCQMIVQKLMKYARKPVREEKTQLVDLNQIISNVVSFLKFQLAQDNVQLITRLNPLPQTEGVFNELEQVFTNLILNSKDAIISKGGPGTIEISTFDNNGSVHAAVKDDGIGIKEEHLSKIFDPFFTTKDIGKGTGLGLSISYGIVEKHGGKIEVSSHPGAGTMFTLSLPKKR